MALFIGLYIFYQLRFRPRACNGIQNGFSDPKNILTYNYRLRVLKPTIYGVGNGKPTFRQYHSQQTGVSGLQSFLYLDRGSPPRSMRLNNQNHTIGELSQQRK
jgi:hypothetical protein